MLKKQHSKKPYDRQKFDQPKFDWPVVEPPFVPVGHWFPPNSTYHVRYRDIEELLAKLRRLLKGHAKMCRSKECAYSWGIISGKKDDPNHFEAVVDVFRTDNSEELLVEIYRTFGDSVAFYKTLGPFLATLRGEEYVPMFPPNYDTVDIQDLSEWPDFPLQVLP